MMLSRLLFKEEYKKYIWALALAILGFLGTKIILPLLDYSNYLQLKKQRDFTEDIKLLKRLNDYLTLDYGFNKVIVIILAIIMGIAIFSYLHNKKKIDFYHSLPITRTKLFLIKYILGIAIVVPVMVIAQFILYAIFSVILGNYIVPFKDILESIVTDILFFITIYSISAFSTILCGNTVISIILANILLNLPTIILFIIKMATNTFFSYFVTGQFYDYMLRYTPIYSYFVMKNNTSYNTVTTLNFSNISILTTYIIISIIVFVISLLLFKIRKSETATSCISFKYAKTILKYLGVCICAILTGIIFKDISRSNILMYVGVLLGAIVFHCIVEIIYNFDFRAIFKNWYSIIGCLIISSIILATYQFDVFKRQNFIPSVEKVQNIDIMFNGTEYYDSQEVKNVEDPQFIEAVIGLHQIYVDLESQPSKKGGNYDQLMSVQYKLKNGTTVGRFIQVFTYSDDEIAKQQGDLVRQMFSSKEFIRKTRPILYVDDLDYNLLNVSIHNNKETFLDRTDFRQVKIDKKVLFEAIRKDVEENGLYSTSDDTLFNIEINWRAWEYNFEKTYVQFFITDKYTNTLNYLASLNIYPNNYTLDDVSYVRMDYLDTRITDLDDIEKILKDYNKEATAGFEHYKRTRVITLYNKDNEGYKLYIDRELYDELKEKYKPDMVKDYED